MPSYVTFAHLAHYASPPCQLPAHYATYLGEAWPPFAACIFAFTGDVNHSRITCNLDWPADTVLIFMNCDRQMQGPFLSCHYAAYYCTTLLGEAWPPVAASNFLVGAISGSGHSRGPLHCSTRHLPPASLNSTIAPTIELPHVVGLASFVTAHYLHANINMSLLKWGCNRINKQVCLTIAWTCLCLQLCGKMS